MDTKLSSNGNIRLWFVPENGFVNPKAPTATEINAGFDFSDAVSWNDFGFGTQASSTGSDPAVTAKGHVASRGSGQYGGSLSLYYPKVFNDDSNIYSLTYDIFAVPGTTGYIVERVDGEELRVDTGTTSQPGLLAAPGDLVHVYKITTDAQADSITGEEAFRYTPSFVSQGELSVYAIVTDGTVPTVVITPATVSVGVGEHAVLSATLDGRNYTRGLAWSTSDASKAVVSINGVVTGVGAGTATITATHPATGATSTATATVA